MLSSRRVMRWRLARPVSESYCASARILELALVIGGHVLGAAAIAEERAAGILVRLAADRPPARIAFARRGAR